MRRAGRVRRADRRTANPSGHPRPSGPRRSRAPPLHPEEKLTATLTSYAPEDVMLEARRELDRQLAPYRRKMTAAQLAQLEKQYTQKRLYESFGLPRLSLFYLTYPARGTLFMEVKIEKLIYGGEGPGTPMARRSLSRTSCRQPDLALWPSIRSNAKRNLFAENWKLSSFHHPRGSRRVARIWHLRAAITSISPTTRKCRRKQPSSPSLRRLGHIEWTGQIQTHAASPWGYRNRAQWEVCPPEKSDPSDQRRLSGIGYFRAGSTALVPVDQCAILSPLLESTLRTLDSLCAQAPFPNRCGNWRRSPTPKTKS